MERNIVVDNFSFSKSAYCRNCNLEFLLDTIEEEQMENHTILYLVYMCPKCEEKVFFLDKEKQYYQDIHKHLKKTKII